ncbi:MAG: DNA-3-methyladenine glycosylase [Thermoplasmata archaeon]|jgi:DNA-3-methyladenine glycosylase|nr:DNA-3-methyladenine glycosylase [Thermoplasmata archaeon]
MRLPRSFYARGADVVARELLGTILVRRTPDGLRRARLVETEAYVGPHDLASHARFGRTARNSVMWGPPGRAYVYFVYGMHNMLNVVCAPEGDAQAVLLRAAEPLYGWTARLNGPGLLARGFGVTRADDGADLVRGGDLWLEPGAAPARIVADRRVGIDFAGPWAHEHLRFLDPASPSISRHPRGSATPWTAARSPARPPS